jgi:hypothetical protein
MLDLFGIVDVIQFIRWVTTMEQGLMESVILEVMDRHFIILKDIWHLDLAENVEDQLVYLLLEYQKDQLLFLLAENTNYQMVHNLQLVTNINTFLEDLVLALTAFTIN